MSDAITIGVSIILPLITGIIMPILLVYTKKHIATTKELLDQRFKNIEAVLTERLNVINTKLQMIETELVNHDALFERIRDRWDSFLREYLKIDSTRGTKIDAMFRVLDTTNENLRGLQSEVQQLKRLDTRIQELQLKLVKLETLQRSTEFEK